MGGARADLNAASWRALRSASVPPHCCSSGASAAQRFLLVEQIGHRIADDRRRGRGAEAAMLDDAADRVARLVGGREGDEQGVVAQRPVALVPARAEPKDLRGSGLARHLHAVERQLRGRPPCRRR